MTIPARRVAIANNKGGTGKTCCTVNLAAALSEAGLRVLVVDLDPQGNAGRRLAHRPDPDNPTPTVSDALKELAEKPGDLSLVGCAVDAFTRIGWPEPYVDRITLLPSRPDLENRSLEAGVMGALFRLAVALDGADDDIDITLIDCPPNLGPLTQMGIAASEGALCVMDPEIDGMEGAFALRDFIAMQRRYLAKPDLEVLGYIVNKIDIRGGAHRFQVEEVIPEEFGDQVWAYIGERTVIKDAADSQPPRPLRTFGSRGSVPAAIFDDLAKRLAARLGIAMTSAEVAR